jgi:hypothetical protein
MAADLPFNDRNMLLIYCNKVTVAADLPFKGLEWLLMCCHLARMAADLPTFVADLQFSHQL